MKTSKTIFGMALVLSFVSMNAMAAGVREVRSKVMEQDKLAVNKEIDVLKKATNAEYVFVKGSQELSKIAGGRADQNELNTAIRRTIMVKTEDGAKQVHLVGIAKKLLKLDQSVSEIRKSGLELTKAGKDHLDALDQAVATGAEFLSLAARTSETTKLTTVLTKTDLYQNAMFNKQLSILGDLAAMETADLKAHTAVMKAAVDRKTGPRVNGDVAFRDALFIDIAKQNEADYIKKTQELLKCI